MKKYQDTDKESFVPEEKTLNREKFNKHNTKKHGKNEVSHRIIRRAEQYKRVNVHKLENLLEEDDLI